MLSDLKKLIAWLESKTRNCTFVENLNTVHVTLTCYRNKIWKLNKKIKIFDLSSLIKIHKYKKTGERTRLNYRTIRMKTNCRTWRSPLIPLRLLSWSALSPKDTNSQQMQCSGETFAIKNNNNNNRNKWDAALVQNILCAIMYFTLFLTFKFAIGAETGNYLSSFVTTKTTRGNFSALYCLL